MSGGTLALKDPFVVPGLFGMMASGQAMVSAGSSINAMDAKNPPAPPVASQSSAVAGAPQGNGPNDDENQNNQNEKETRPTDRYKENLDQRTLDAARRELRGETVRLKSGGDAYDHITKVREAQRGLLNRIEAITKRLGSPSQNTPANVIEGLKKELGDASRLLDYSRKFVP